MTVPLVGLARSLRRFSLTRAASFRKTVFLDPTALGGAPWSFQDTWISKARLAKPEDGLTAAAIDPCRPAYELPRHRDVRGLTPSVRLTK